VELDQTFIGFQEFGENDLDKKALQATDHILNGMKKIISSHHYALPVVNKNNKLMGVFSRGALDAL
ncbi:MAG: hypothetical protein HRT44_12870, partial [Bdellovibrionales bacterium]|nr:hypothetical protein [Bdellovibrionales bacterium]NQZ20129.1 hypothetical protein [Bdellovibrionales bacterium]